MHTINPTAYRPMVRVHFPQAALVSDIYAAAAKHCVEILSVEGTSALRPPKILRVHVRGGIEQAYALRMACDFPEGLTVDFTYTAV